MDPGLPHLTGVAHNIRKGKGTTQIFSHVTGGADFVMLGEVNKELDLPLNLSTGPRVAKIFQNLGEGGTNGFALVVGPGLAPFSSALPPPRSVWAAGGLPCLPAPLRSFRVGFRLLPTPPNDEGLQRPPRDCCRGPYVTVAKRPTGRGPQFGPRAPLGHGGSHKPKYMAMAG